MCDTYLGRVENLDYKTMRYPGHMDLMNFFFHELLLRERRELAGEILTNAKPPVDDDVVYIHVSSEGTMDGELRRSSTPGRCCPRRSPAHGASDRLDDGGVGRGGHRPRA